jgi:hypothetical protein
MHLGIAEILSGNRQEGLIHLQTAERLFGDSIPSFRIVQIAYAYSHLDRRADVDRLFTKLSDTAENDPVSRGMWAMGYLALGDSEQAWQHLEAAVVPGEPLIVLGQLKANEFDDPVLEEPRFKELRDRIGALN